jgi:hypothetical protein
MASPMHKSYTKSYKNALDIIKIAFYDSPIATIFGVQA